MGILQELRQWRDTQARTEGVETFRVFPNAVLDALVGALPQNKEEMLAIKGIKEAKFGKYGAALLRIIGEYAPDRNGRGELLTAEIKNGEQVVVTGDAHKEEEDEELRFFLDVVGSQLVEKHTTTS